MFVFVFVFECSSPCRQFTTCPSWLHLDMAGVMENAGDVSYLGKGMSGRPTRTLVQYAASLAQNR